MDSVRKLFRSVSSLFSSTPMPVPAAQQSHVSDTYCDRNASQNMASTVGGTGTSPVAISDSIRPSMVPQTETRFKFSVRKNSTKGVFWCYKRVFV